MSENIKPPVKRIGITINNAIIALKTLVFIIHLLYKIIA
jgi:hypothetical protein